MAEFLSQKLIGRLAALLFIASGALTLANLAIPRQTAFNRPALGAIALDAIAIGALCWYLPWQRWRPAATLPLVPIAFGLIAAGDIVKGDPFSYAIYYVVAFVWIGVAHRRGTSLRVGPLAAVFYVVPFVIRSRSLDELMSVTVAIPVCLLVGESLAWISSKLRQAERLDIRRMNDMEALLGATVSLAQQQSAVGAANLVAELAVKLLRADASVVLLADDDGNLRGTGGFHWQGRVQSLESSWLDQPARDAIATGNLATHAGGIVGQLTRAGRGAPALFLPLRGTSGTLGLVMVTFPAGTRMSLDGFAAGLARTFATQAGLAFDRLQATQLLVDASMRDALTGVGNRRQADAMLSQLRTGDAIVILDCDHFKAVNDRFGHSTGDEVLVQLARFLDRALRDGDAVARYGGEEFLVVLRQPGASAGATVDRLLASWRDTHPVTTFSAGLAVHGLGAAVEDTVVRADGALYAAKAAGRDCVVEAGQLATELLAALTAS